MNDDNIVQFGSVKGGKGDDEKFPTHPYYIEDIDGNEYYAEGYLIFTSHHVCIMGEGDNGPVTVLMVPLSRVKLTEIVGPDEDEDTRTF